MEVWKDIVGFEGLYQVSSEGRVKALDRVTHGKHRPGMIRRPSINKVNGYSYINLSKDGVARNYLLHRIVATAFVDNPNGYETVNHKNEKKQDNRAENLEWMTLADNLRYGTHVERATKNKPSMKGEKHPNFGKRGSESVTHKGRVIGISLKDPAVIVEFDTAATAGRELGLSTGQLCDAINGKAKSCGGYRWRRINE